MTFALGRNTIPGEFFTAGSRISCRISVPPAGLSALLVDPLHSYLELEDAYVSRVNTPGEIVAHFDLAAVRKDNILFILLPRREEGTLPKGGSGFVRSVLKDAFLTMPSFEIRGQVETDPNASPWEFLIQSIGRFVPVHDATVTVALFPDISFGGKLVLVNREQIESFCFG